MNLFLNDTNVKRGIFLNLLCSGLIAFFNSILLFIITRVTNIEQGGYFSLAYAIGYECWAIGSFATYNVQVSDSKKEYSFSDFFYIRIISMIMMLVLLSYYAFLNGYSSEKALIILSFGIVKGFEAFEDIFKGEYHRNNKLDVAASVVLVRYILVIIIFSISYIVTKNLVICFTLIAILNFVLFYILNKNYIKYFDIRILKFNKIKFKTLFLILLPLCISQYLMVLLQNIPKYAIDNCLTMDMQTIFSILILPSSIVTLITEIAIAPIIPVISEKLNDHMALFKLSLIQIGLILIVTIGCIIGGYVIGLKLLEMIFATPLMSYMPSLIILLIAGGFKAITIYLNLIIIVLRKQNMTAIAYVSIAIISYLIANSLVMNYQLEGASLIYLIEQFGLCIIYTFTVIRALSNKN